MARSDHDHHPVLASADFPALLSELTSLNTELRNEIPEVFRSYGLLHQASMREGALSTKVKELMALAIGISDRCDGCIASHAKSAVRAGASREEVAETIGVAILLSGGPGTAFGARAWEAYLAFSEKDR